MNRWTRNATRLVAVGTCVIAAGCGGSGGGGDKSPTSPSGPSTSTSVSVRDNSFSPAATTVPAGSTVTWTWTGSEPHNVTFNDGPASASQAAGSYTRTFATVGTYAYHCTIHGSVMSGTITVQ